MQPVPTPTLPLEGERQLPDAPANRGTGVPLQANLVVLTLLMLGALLRFWAIGQIPPGLYHDEAYNALDALAVLNGETPLPLYFPANNGREPLFIYLVTASVAVFGRSPLAVRLPAAFAGWLTLAAAYDLGRVLWGKRAGRWTLAVLAVTFWHVHLSRVGFRAVLLPLFTALWLAQAARALRTGKARHWFAAGALYGASWYTYMAARFTPVALTVMLAYGLWVYFARRGALAPRPPWRGGLLFCLAALLLLAPLGLYTLRHPDIVLQRTGQVSVFSPEINGGNLPGALLDHTLRTAGMFFMRGDRIWRHNLAWRPVWGPALGLAFVIGLGVALARWRASPGAALVLLWTAVMALPTLLAEDAPHFLRGVGVLPTAALLPALGLAWLEDRLQQAQAGLLTAPAGGAVRDRPQLRCFLTALPALLVAFGGLHTAGDYFLRYARAPEAYHWFEAGPVALAGRINALRGEGWDGARMLHGPPTERVIVIDRQLWDAWSAVPYLTPAEAVSFLPATAPLDASRGGAFIVWPYRDWQPDVLPLLPHPAYLRVERGPQAQGDKDPEPFTIATIIRADPLPELPAPVAQFAPGVTLLAALVQPESDGVLVHLYWQTAVPLPESITVFVHYLRDGAPLAQHDGVPGYGHLPTTLWQPGDLIGDAHPLPGLAPDPARDTLRVGLYHSATGESLPALDAGGNPSGGWVELPVILVETQP